MSAIVIRNAWYSSCGCEGVRKEKRKTWKLGRFFILYSRPMWKKNCFSSVRRCVFYEWSQSTFCNTVWRISRTVVSAKTLPPSANVRLGETTYLVHEFLHQGINMTVPVTINKCSAFFVAFFSHSKWVIRVLLWHFVVGPVINSDQSVQRLSTRLVQRKGCTKVFWSINQSIEQQQLHLLWRDSQSINQSINRTTATALSVQILSINQSINHKLSHIVSKRKLNFDISSCSQ